MPNREFVVIAQEFQPLRSLAVCNAGMSPPGFETTCYDGRDSRITRGRFPYTYPITPTAVVLDSCDIYSLGDRKRRAAIFCEKVPNQIIVRNCRGLCDLPVIGVSEKLDLDTYFDNAERQRACLRFAIGEENVEVFDSNRDLPEPMRPYQVNRVVADTSPKSAHWHRGAIVWNRNREGTWTPQGFVKSTTPADKEPFGWLCVESGKPGVWREVYGVLERARNP